jgi:hypothetical protein
MNNTAFTLHDYYQMQQNYVRSSKSKRTSAIQCKDGKCSNCNRYVGMKFSVVRPKGSNDRMFTVKCGGVPDAPDEARRACPLNIELRVPDKQWTPELLQEVRTSLLEQREDIVHYKNRMQFGFDQEDKISHEFTEALDDLSRQSVLYDGLMQGLAATLNEGPRRQALIRAQTELYEVVLPAYAQLCQTDRYLAAEYYLSDVLPKQREIQQLRYSDQHMESSMFHKHEYHTLVQHVHPWSAYETGDPETTITVVKGILRQKTKRVGMPPQVAVAAKEAAVNKVPKNKTVKRVM